MTARREKYNHSTESDLVVWIWKHQNKFFQTWLHEEKYLIIWFYHTGLFEKDKILLYQMWLHEIEFYEDWLFEFKNIFIKYFQIWLFELKNAKNKCSQIWLHVESNLIVIIQINLLKERNIIINFYQTWLHEKNKTYHLILSDLVVRTEKDQIKFYQIRLHE